MFLTVCLWILGIGVAIILLQFLFVLVMSIIQGYSERGFWGAITFGLVTAGMGLTSLIMTAFKYIVIGLVIIGIIWVFHSCTKSDKPTKRERISKVLSEEVKAEAMQFRDSIDFRNQARRITNPPSSTSLVYEVSEEDHNLAIQLLKKGFAACNKISDSTLALMHNDMPLHYRNQYQAGLKKYISGIERMDIAEMLLGQKMCDDFGDWYMNEVKAKK